MYVLEFQSNKLSKGFFVSAAGNFLNYVFKRQPKNLHLVQLPPYDLFDRDHVVYTPS